VPLAKADAEGIIRAISAVPDATAQILLLKVPETWGIRRTGVTKVGCISKPFHFLHHRLSDRGGFGQHLFPI
jgi:hypothetical protein